jgi:Secretion system C-terminal sorting domain
MRIFRPILLVTFLAIGFSSLAQEPTSNSSNELAKTVKLYPNPAVEFLTVKFETAQAKKSKFALHNIIGNELPLEYEVVDDFEVRIKVKDFSTGFYLLFIKNEDTGLKGAYKFLKK